MALLATNWNPTRRELRQFAFFWLSLVVALLAVQILSRGGSVPALIWLPAVLPGLVGLIAPQAMRLLYVAAVAATYPIGWVIGHVILAIVFFGLVTPIGLILRRVGHDPLRRQFDRSAKSYWRPRPPEAGPAQYFRQF